MLIPDDAGSCQNHLSAIFPRYFSPLPCALLDLSDGNSSGLTPEEERVLTEIVRQRLYNSVLSAIGIPVIYNAYETPTAPALHNTSIRSGLGRLLMFSANCKLNTWSCTSGWILNTEDSLYGSHEGADNFREHNGLKVTENVSAESSLYSAGFYRYNAFHKV